jgi:hypothetical protein
VRTQRQAIDDMADMADMADVAGVPRVKVAAVPSFVIRALGAFSPLKHELPGSVYLFETPFVIDDSATREVFNLEPTSWVEVRPDTIESYRSDDSTSLPVSPNPR